MMKVAVMRKISRARRAELQRRAHEIRRRGQRSGSEIARIAADIQAELPELLNLEVWRLAYGWTRPQVIAGIAALYAEEHLADPPVTSSMLCRWEHGDVRASDEYVQALCRLYHATPRQIGLVDDSAALRAATGHLTEYVSADGGRVTAWNGYPMTADNDAALAALRESIELALDVEGPAGGPLTREQLTEAVAYYALRYSAFPPAHLAVRCTARAHWSARCCANLRATPVVPSYVCLRAGSPRLLLGDDARARVHAEASKQKVPHGRPGWAAAVLVQARGEVARGSTGDATALAHHVLNTLAAPALRETLRVRLRDLDRDLFTAADPGSEARELRDRLRTLPRMIPADRTSDEPNGR